MEIILYEIIVTIYCNKILTLNIAFYQRWFKGKVNKVTVQSPQFYQSLNKYYQNDKIKINKIIFKIYNISRKLNGLCILSIEKDILANLEYKDLINNFASQKVRKINFK